MIRKLKLETDLNLPAVYVLSNISDELFSNLMLNNLILRVLVNYNMKCVIPQIFNLATPPDESANLTLNKINQPISSFRFICNTLDMA